MYKFGHRANQELLFKNRPCLWIPTYMRGLIEI